MQIAGRDEGCPKGVVLLPCLEKKSKGDRAAPAALAGGLEGGRRQAQRAAGRGPGLQHKSNGGQQQQQRSEAGTATSAGSMGRRAHELAIRW